MKYFANMSVNNGTTFQKDLEGTNKSVLAKQVAHSAKANVFVGNEYSWKVWNEEGTIVAAGAGVKTENGYSYLSCEHLIGEMI